MTRGQIATLADVCESVRYGYTASASSDPCGPRFLRITDIVPDSLNWKSVPYCEIDDDNKERFGLKVGDIVVARTGATVGYAKLIREPEDAVFASYLVRFRIDPNKADPAFVGRLVESNVYKAFVQSRVGGAAQPNASAPVLASFEFALPSMHSQSRIADILSAFDELMENNRRRMGLLENAARLLYQEWFVCLRFPGYEHTPITHRLPQGWQSKALGEFIQTGMVHLQTGPFGTQLKASDYTDDGIPVINVRNIGYGGLRADKLEYVPEEISDRLSAHLLRTGDIVFGRKGAVDRHLLVTGAQNGWMQGSDCIRLRALSDEVCPFLLTFAFRQPAHHDWMLGQCGNKATMASLNHDVISRIPLIVPARPILNEFRHFVADCLTQIANLSAQNQKLRAARDLLLPRLMAGEIEV